MRMGIVWTRRPEASEDEEWERWCVSMNGGAGSLNLSNNDWPWSALTWSANARCRRPVSPAPCTAMPPPNPRNPTGKGGVLAKMTALRGLDSREEKPALPNDPVWEEPNDPVVWSTPVVFPPSWRLTSTLTIPPSGRLVMLMTLTAEGPTRTAPGDCWGSDDLLSYQRGDGLPLLCSITKVCTQINQSINLSVKNIRFHIVNTSNSRLAKIAKLDCMKWELKT